MRGHAHIKAAGNVIVPSMELAKFRMELELWVLKVKAKSLLTRNSGTVDIIKKINAGVIIPLATPCLRWYQVA